MFLDIESTGLSRYYDNITIIGWSIGGKYEFFIQNEDSKKFYKAVENAKAIVTFNGNIFDIPFIHQEFPGVKIPLSHVDLRFFAKKDNFSGGQKIIEEEIGFKRPKELNTIKGETAPILWYKYRFGNIKDLEKLIYYNYVDIEGMKFIFDKIAYQLVYRNQFPIEIEGLPKFYLQEFLPFKEFKSKFLKSHKLPVYKGKPGPKIYLDELTASYKKQLKIVGIDLTGSEKRPSGWCFLDHDYAQTSTIKSDEEIIEQTIKLKPDIISIDSPLSLPHGRIHVYDNDPGRDIYGIMREAEKILKSRGVNVYPSLIPSMQRLTERGIKLAKIFREYGFPVIESYPGAAQDIIDIPRKQAGLQYLKIGLEKFGIKGDYILQDVSHDELDAITSAIVGHFFWSGKFEALGNEEEEYLIIPSLSVNNSKWVNRRVIGLSGYIYAGKTTAGKYLLEKGYNYGRYSLVLKQMLKEKGVDVNRESLQSIGIEMNKNQRILCKRVFEYYPKNGDIVIDGLRFPIDHAYWIEKYGPAFLHLFIDASENSRMERYIYSGMSAEEFISATSHNVEKGVFKLKNLADYIIKNNSSIENFCSNLSSLINKHFN